MRYITSGRWLNPEYQFIHLLNGDTDNLLKVVVRNTCDSVTHSKHLRSSSPVSLGQGWKIEHWLVLKRYEEGKEQKMRNGRVGGSQRLIEYGPLNELKPDNPEPKQEARLSCIQGERALDKTTKWEPKWPIGEFFEFIKKSVFSKIYSWDIMELYMDLVDDNRMWLSVISRMHC